MEHDSERYEASVEAELKRRKTYYEHHHTCTECGFECIEEWIRERVLGTNGMVTIDCSCEDEGPYVCGDCREAIDAAADKAGPMFTTGWQKEPV